MTISYLGHYKIVSELGRGGMGVVFKGHEEKLDRYVAIKVLAEKFAADPEVTERFLREARGAAAISHPNVVNIYFIGEEAGKHFFAMEYVVGESLSEHIRRLGHLDEKAALTILKQSASGLAAAHEKGIIHRDIKPGNILLDGKGHVKITDFGIAFQSELKEKLTATGQFLGTPGYLSPEVCLGQKADARTDIFALGIVFYEMLTGSLPFKADSPYGLMHQVIKTEIPDVRNINKAVSLNAHILLSRMTAKDPNNRYGSCEALLRDIEKTLSGSVAIDADDLGESEATTQAKAVVQTEIPTEQLTLPSPDLPPIPGSTADGQGETQATRPVAAPVAAPPPPAATTKRPEPEFIPPRPENTGGGAKLGILLVSAVFLTIIFFILMFFMRPWETAGKPDPVIPIETTQDTTDPTQSDTPATVTDQADPVNSSGDPIQEQPNVEGAGSAGSDNSNIANPTDNNSDQVTNNAAYSDTNTPTGPPTGGSGTRPPESNPAYPAEEPSTSNIQRPEKQTSSGTNNLSGNTSSSPQQHSANDTPSAGKPMEAKRSGIAVVALGHPAIRNHVETLLEDWLSADGQDIQDERMSLAVDDLLNSNDTPSARRLVEVIREEGNSRLVLAEITHTGQRTAAGSPVYSADIKVSVYELGAMKSLGRKTVSMEYPEIKAKDRANDALLTIYSDLLEMVKKD